MIVKGYEIVRSDTSKICAIMQEKIFRMVLDGKRKDEVKEYINKTKNDLKSNKYSVFDVGVPKPWKERTYKGKTVYHIVAAEWSNRHLGTDFKPGSRFFIIYVKSIAGLTTPKNGAIAFDEGTKLPKIIINWDKMFPIIIDNKVKKIFEVLGWDDKPKIKGLDEY